MDQELIDMVDMFTNICTRQEEKFDFWRRNGCPWLWQDLEAAFDLFIEATAKEGLNRWNIMSDCSRRHYNLTHASHVQLLRVFQSAHGWRTDHVN